MTMLSPAATYHAELRQQLGTVGRTLSLRRAVMGLARGLAAGAVVVLGLVIWSWLRDGGIGMWPLPLLIGVPFATGVLAAAATAFVRQSMRDVARRVDRAAHLNERTTTALELGARGDEFPLAIAQMRDAVEHLQRVDLLEAFPLPIPRTELLTTFFVVVVAVLIAVSPNPWLLRARASNPAISIAREQAQRVQRLADGMPASASPELEALRTLVTKGARTVDARSNEPALALNALQDVEEQVRQMSAGDDQLTAALAAIASALASDPTTQALSSAINTGDMRQIGQAARDLAQTTSTLSGQDQQRVSRVLRDAAGRAGRVSQTVASQLSDAADALATGSGGDPAATGATAQTGQANAGGARQQTGDSAPAARDAMNNLADSAAAAAERQRAASQIESSRNALERALGRTQSRSGTSTQSAPSTSQRTGNAANASSTQTGDAARAGERGQPGDGTNDSADGAGNGGAQGSGGDQGQGSGYSTGGQNQNRTGPATRLDTITSPQQVPGSGAYAPDQSRTNPYLADAGSGSVQAPTEKVQPSYSNKPTSGNDSGSIPMGLRDLVKDYFSSLDQR